jgi:DNA primase
MDKQELQKLRDLPIEGVAERLGLQVSRHKCLCPFHPDKHPSLSFSTKRNTFCCFSCGAKGGTIDLVMNYLHLDFKSACRWLADANNVLVQEVRSVQEVRKVQPFDPTRYARFFEHPILSEPARQFLFEERKLDERVIRWCRLTSWRDKHGTDWLQIPYYDREGKLIGIQNRNLTKGASPRFRFPYGAQCSIYNLPVLNRLQQGEALYITEGCSDCWAMLSVGHKAIAIPSATLLKPADKALLSTLNSELSTIFHMYPDRDEPGERLFLQLQQVLPNLEHHQLPLGCKDFSEYYVSTKS